MKSKENEEDVDKWVETYYEMIQGWKLKYSITKPIVIHSDSKLFKEKISYGFKWLKLFVYKRCVI